MPVSTTCDIRNNNAKIAVIADEILEREDSDFYEALWLEVERMVSAKGRAAQDAREDMTLKDIMRVVAQKMATEQFNAG